MLHRIACALAAMSAASAKHLFEGFVLTSYRKGEYVQSSTAQVAAQMAQTGVRAVEVMFTYYVQNSVNSTQIFADPEQSPSDDDVLNAIAQVHKAGMAVTMKPHIDCKDGVWRANIGTKFTSAQQWSDWFANYTAFVLHAADLAILSGVPIAGFNVGTELDGTHAHATEWRAVIAAVRSRLGPSVPLWLGPNWGWDSVPGYQLVTFWDALDYLGVDMYAPLASHNDPTLAEAVAGWQPLIANLSAWWEQHGSPTKGFIFAEIGYASYQGAATNAPGCCTGPIDLQTQATLYQSFFEAVWDQPWMAGVFWWAWPASSAPGGTPCSTGFDVYGKPAAAIMSQYYSQGMSAAVAQTAYSAALATLPSSASAPVIIYSDGKTTWNDWSWGSTVNLTDAAGAYPGHTSSASVVVSSAGGAFTLHVPSGAQRLDGLTSLTMDIVVPNVTLGFELSAFFCACTSCDSACSLPAVQMVLYSQDGQQCTLASDWASQPSAARVVLPLDKMAPGRNATTTIARVQVGANSAVAFRVDNIQLA